MDADKKEADTSTSSPQPADSLETPETIAEPTVPNTASDKERPARAAATAPDAESTAGAVAADSPSPKKPKNSWRERWHALSNRFNIYLLMFILLLVIASIIVVVAVFQAHKTSNNSPTVNNQSLSQSALQQLSNSDASVGTSSQTLNVQSNAVFAGQVIIRSNLEVAGTIKVGGTISLPSVTVAGTSTFGQVQASSLAVSGNTAVQGNLTTGGNLNVSGTGSFGSLSAQRLSVGALQLNGALILTSHITAGGPIPRKADGNALGSGGTSSVSGSDTAGTIAINTGGGPAAGCFITVTFAQPFNGTPRVLLTPVSSSAAGLPYYVTRTSSNFSVCTAAPAAAGQNISFDYAIFD